MQLPVSVNARAARGETVQSHAEPAADSIQPRQGVWEVPLDWQPELDLHPELDWQPELDAALEAIDSCLPVKRRRATDPPDSPPFPRAELSGVNVTPEVLDALAARVAEKLRAGGRARQAPAAEPPPMKAGAVVSIRFRWPLFSFGFSRRRRRAMVRA